MNKRQKKKNIKKLCNKLLNCRKNNKNIIITCQTPIYEKECIVGIRTHNPIIKEINIKDYNKLEDNNNE